MKTSTSAKPHSVAVERKRPAKAKKTRTAAPATAPRKGAASDKPKKALRRKTYVRGSILELLKTKRKTRNQLLAEGGFAASALDRNLKLLRDEKLIDTRGTRPLLFGLISTAATSPSKVTSLPAAKAITEPAGGIPRNSKLGRLNEALDQYHRRMAPKEQVSEKLLVLERLAEGASAPIADVLRAIQRDYASA